MRRTGIWALGATVSAVALSLAWPRPSAGQGAAPARPRPPLRRPAAPASTAPSAPPADEGALYTDAAALASRFVQANLQPTGLVSALRIYQYATVWDIASGLAALYCAHELGLVDDARYDTQIRKMLRTLKRVELFDGAAFNKVYSTRTGAMARDDRPSKRGSGWSAIDLGRLLLWLKIVAVHQPQYADDAAAVVKRLDASRVVADGYTRGASLKPSGQVFEYQEGRVGYEQYAARGFAAWDFPVDGALDIKRNSVPLAVMGRTLLGDVRGNDRLTAEPFALIGLEVGFAPDERALAEQLLAAMEERYRRSGRLTMLGEDAIGRAPYYFYYYCAYANGKEFAVDVQDPRAFVDAPRWLSAKGAFAWRVLFPTDYTARILAAVLPARTPLGWGSGIYESEGRSTGTVNINTQAVILEAALVRKRAQPLMATPRQVGQGRLPE